MVVAVSAKVSAKVSLLLSCNGDRGGGTACMSVTRGVSNPLVCGREDEDGDDGCRRTSSSSSLLLLFIW